MVGLNLYPKVPPAGFWTMTMFFEVNADAGSDHGGVEAQADGFGMDVQLAFFVEVKAHPTSGSMGMCG